MKTMLKGIKVEYNLNLGKNGIEIKFSDIPCKKFREEILKTKHGFRWSNKKFFWYAKITENRLNFVKSIATKTENNTETKNNIISLWDISHKEIVKIDKKILENMSRTEIAKAIKKELNILKIFNFKFSVQKDGYRTIYITIKESPFKDNEIYKAVEKYIKNTGLKYEYCISYDPYGDYGSTYNIHISIDSYNPIVNKLNEDIEKEIFIDWNKKQKIENEKLEKERLKQISDYEKQQKENKINYEIAVKKEQEQRKIIENNILIKELNNNEYYIIYNVQYPKLNRNQTLKQYEEEKKDSYYQDTEIRKEINFTNIEAYNYFCNMLLDDFFFINKKDGGHYFVDERMTDIIDYFNMTAEQQKSVKWNDIGILITLKNEIKFIVNNEGYNYCRYVGFIEEGKSSIKKESCKIVNFCSIENEEIEQNKQKALTLIDLTSEIVANNNLPIFKEMEQKDKEKFFKLLYLKLKEFKTKYLTKESIRLIPKDYILLKSFLYEYLKFISTVQFQASHNQLEIGKKYTLIYISEMGMISKQHITLKNWNFEKYAQYNNALRLNYIQKNKRKEYYQHFYKDLIIFENFIDYPNTLLNSVEKHNNMIITSSLFLSCDTIQYKKILDYFKEQNIKPVINATEFQ